MATFGAEAEPRRLAVGGQAGGVENKVGFGERLVALPEADLVVHNVDASRAFADLVGAEKLGKLGADRFRIEREGDMGAGSVFLKAAPVALEGERYTFENAQSGEEAPAAQEAGLSGREADLLNREEAAVVRDVAMNHGSARG